MTRTDEIDRARASEVWRTCHLARERLQLAADYVAAATLHDGKNPRAALAALVGAERNAQQGIAHATRASALIAAEQQEKEQVT